MGHQIDAVRGALGENDFMLMGCMEVRLQLASGELKGVC